ncbi:MAG: GNAT family N-acetyltransferase [Muribaculaceae bacterium]|nr:GNAT family N-acetyltransferase [Muribaculaceae bacterium]
MAATDTKFKINYYTLRDFETLKPVWDELARGEEMTFFQSHDWYRMLVSRFPDDNSRWLTRFVVVSSGDGPVMLAPLWVVRRTFNIVNRKGVYFLGRQGWTDYLNFIYHTFDAGALDFLMKCVSRDFGIKSWTLELMKEGTSAFAHIQSRFSFQVHTITKCVALSLPDTVDDYHKSLSKSSRQNIRTAINRMTKDGIEPAVEFSLRDSVDTDTCIAMRAERVQQKNSRIHLGFATALRKRITDALRFHPPVYFPLADCPATRLLSIKDGDTLMAFFNYGLNPHTRQAVMMAVGTSDAHRRYSPGIVAMYKFICDAIENNSLDSIDFTKGDEPYKYALGGKDHFIHSVRISL